jgi:hypothetical protein
MAKRLKLFPVVTLLSVLPLVLPMVLGASAVARAADQPVASAVIPPPLPDTPVVVSPNAASPTTARPKRTPTAKAASKPAVVAKAPAAIASPAKPGSRADAEPSKRVLRPSAVPSVETAKRAAAQKPSRHAERERHLQFAGGSALPRYPTRPRYYYPGAPVIGPDFDGPPSWYDRGMPPGYPRGPW